LNDLDLHREHHIGVNRSEGYLQLSGRLPCSRGDRNLLVVVLNKFQKPVDTAFATSAVRI
jgi:hypothetical protein